MRKEGKGKGGKRPTEPIPPGKRAEKKEVSRKTRVSGSTEKFRKKQTARMGNDGKKR